MVTNNMETPIINDYKATESFIADKLIGAQLDSFLVHSIALDLTLLCDYIGTNIHGDVKHDLQRCYLGAGAEICVIDGQKVYKERSEVVGRLYSLIGQEISSVKINSEGDVAITISGKEIVLSKDDDPNLEFAWTFSPNSSSIFDDHEWIVIMRQKNLEFYPPKQVAYK